MPVIVLLSAYNKQLTKGAITMAKRFMSKEGSSNNHA